MNCDDKPQFTDIALDFETLAVSSHNPAIIAVGMVAFNAEIPGSTYASIYRAIYVEDALRYGTLDGSTFLWWLQQSDEARAKIVNATNRVAVTQAAADMQQFVYQYARGGRLWTNGPAQDETWWRSLCKATGHEFPIHHSRGRDMRTAREFIDMQTSHDIQEGLVKHDALSDAVWTSRVVTAFYTMLREKGILPWTN